MYGLFQFSYLPLIHPSEDIQNSHVRTIFFMCLYIMYLGSVKSNPLDGRQRRCQRTKSPFLPLPRYCSKPSVCRFTYSGYTPRIRGRKTRLVVPDDGFNPHRRTVNGLITLVRMDWARLNATTGSTQRWLLTEYWMQKIGKSLLEILDGETYSVHQDQVCLVFVRNLLTVRSREDLEECK